MRKMLVVAMREYQAAVKTKAFIISLVAAPIMMGIAIGMQKFMQGKVDISDKIVAIVDHTDQLLPSLITAANQRNDHDIFSDDDDTKKQIKPRYLLQDAHMDDDDPEKISLELSDRVRNKELFAFVIIGQDVIHPDAHQSENPNPQNVTVKYHSNTPTNDDLPRWIKGPLNAKILSMRFQAENLDPAIVQRATKTVPLANLSLVSMDETGKITKAKRTNKAANFLLPFGMMMLMYMVIMLGASPLMQGVLEEKMNRIAEVLLGSIPPFQFMLGKLIGTVGISLTIATVYLVGAYVSLQQSGYGALFPTHIIWWFVLYQVLAVFMYGSFFIAVGAAVTDLKEAQSLMMPGMLLVMFPFFIWMQVIKEPSSTLSIALSLFPPATPMLMTIRQIVPPGVPTWQSALGAVLVATTSLLMVIAAGRIFRVGILMQGRGAKIREMIRWLFTSNQPSTTTNTDKI